MITHLPVPRRFTRCYQITCQSNRSLRLNQKNVDTPYMFLLFVVHVLNMDILLRIFCEIIKYIYVTDRFTRQIVKSK